METAAASAESRNGDRSHDRDDEQGGAAESVEPAGRPAEPVQDAGPDQGLEAIGAEETRG
jgi:hypothetical protein